MVSLVGGTAKDPCRERGNLVAESDGETIEAMLRELLTEGANLGGPVLLRFLAWRLKLSSGLIGGRSNESRRLDCEREPAVSIATILVSDAFADGALIGSEKLRTWALFIDFSMTGFRVGCCAALTPDDLISASGTRGTWGGISEGFARKDRAISQW